MHAVLHAGELLLPRGHGAMTETRTGSSDGAASERALAKGEDGGSSPSRRSIQPLVHYCIVREDLPVGTMAAQLVHAAGESGPVKPGTIAIALRSSRAAIYQLLEELGGDPRFSIAPVYETDGDYAGQLMAIGFAPVERSSRLRPLLRRFRLVS